MQNVKVCLVHTDAPPSMKLACTRVIDGRLLHAESVEGRAQEAKAIYNRMMGVKSTPHPYEITETDEPAYTPEPIPVSSAGQYIQAQEDKSLTRMSAIIAEGIAKGVAEALAAQQAPKVSAAPAPVAPPEQPAALVDSPAEPDQPSVSSRTGTMATPKRSRPSL